MSDAAEPGRDELPETAVTLRPAGPVRAALRAPASKSVTNRLLGLAALAEGSSRLREPLHSDDAAAMRRVIAGLGVEVSDAGDGDLVVHGAAGRLHPRAGELDAGLSGTTLRFGVALACLGDRPVVLTGAAPLRRRPTGALTAALGELGAAIRDADGYPPVWLQGGGLRGGVATVDVRASSQFASAVLLAAPYAAEDVRLTVEGDAGSAYIALTAALMREWGAEVHGEARQWLVRAGQGYRGREVTVEYDASAAAHLYALAAATGGVLTVENAVDGSRQPDAGILEVLAGMGAHAERSGAAVTVTGPQQLRPIEVDLGEMPDQVTTVAALAALAAGTSRLRGVGVARGHETDRLAVLADELGRLGVRVEEEPDGLVVHGGTAQGPARLATHDDHRLAMAFAAIGARIPGITVEEPWCVTKTYPGFWRDLRRAGVAWEPEPASGADASG